MLKRYLFLFISGLFVFSSMLVAEPSPQEERFLFYIRAIRKSLNSLSADKPLEKSQASEIRVAAFSLEELLRAYDGKYKELEPLFAPVKGLEDRTGRYIDALEHLAVGEKIGLGEGAMSYLRGIRDATFQDLTGFLNHPDTTWTKRSGFLAKMQKTLSEVEWEGANKDRKYLLKYMSDKNQDMIKKVYDLTKTQGDGGFHDLRRDIRKLAILEGALNTNGKLVLWDTSVPGYDRLMQNKELIESKYGNLPVTKVAKSAIFMERPLFLRQTQIIGDIGLAKDLKEAKEEWLHTALIEGKELAPQNGESARDFEMRVEREVEALMDKNPAWQGKSESKIQSRIQRSVLNSSFFKAFKRHLDTQMEWSKKDCRKLAKKLVSGN